MDYAPSDSLLVEVPVALDIARAWKDEEYRKTLTPAELASLPENPAGAAALSEKELADVSGGKTGVTLPVTAHTCPAIC
jgi:mersacidin/lichenicidin family type 2 lantibiotic